jgi:hypothetical protein
MKQFLYLGRITRQRSERGVAMLIALFALLLLASISMGMMFMSRTETLVNANYRDAQIAYFASQAGLEEARERIRTSAGITAPAGLPALGAAGNVVYIINPGVGEVVAPWDIGNPYYDSELCHENFPGLGLTDSGANIPCPRNSTGLPAAGGWYTAVNSNDPQRGTNGSLQYKWVRITLKTNRSLGVNYLVNGDPSDIAHLDTQVCFDSRISARNEVLLARNTILPFVQPAGQYGAEDIFGTLAAFAFGPKGKTIPPPSSTPPPLPPPPSGPPAYAPGIPSSPDACQRQSADLFSVYLITSLSVTRNGGRRMTQFELSRTPLAPIPGGLTLNGIGANFLPANSNNFKIDGHDQAPAAPAPGSCPGSPAPAIHAITANGMAERTSLITQVQTNGREDHYVGLGNDQQTDDPPGPAIEYAAGQQYDALGNPTEVLPDIADGSIVDPNDPTATAPVLEKLDTVAENEELAATFTETADTLAPGDVDGAINLPLRNPACNFNDWQMGTEDPTAPADCQGAKITVVQGDFKVQNSKGVGILLVTGTLTISGNFEWNGIILAIGAGQIIANGGGNRIINGGVYVAQTKNRSNGTLLPGLGSPFVDWNGGGVNSLLYNSCRVTNPPQRATFRVIAYREMTY